MQDNYDFHNMKRVPNRIAQRLGNRAKPALVNKKTATKEELDILENKLKKLSLEDRQFYEECCEKKYSISLKSP